MEDERGPTDETAIFDAIGGVEQPFFDLVEAFYRHVESDPPLRALYPHDLEPGKRHLAWFLIQRFGGPEQFNRQRGAPRLRMRHSPFAITPEQAGRWLTHMTEAISETAIFAPHAEAMQTYFEDAAAFLVNRGPLPEGKLDITHIPIRQG